MEAVVNNIKREAFADASRTRGGALFYFAIATCTAAVCASVSRESLWIDEGFTAWVTSHVSLAATFAALWSPLTATSDRQCPLYTVYLWTWCHCFGNSEIALRTANFPFVAIYITTIATTSRRILGRSFAWIPFAVAPFVWFYVSEARPYLAVLAASTVVTASAIHFAYSSDADSRRQALRWFLLSIIVAFATSLLVILLVPGIIVIFLAAYRDRWNVFAAATGRSLLIFVPFLIAIAAYYSTTMHGSALQNEMKANKRAATPIAFTAQIIYEDLGLDGLGPPRNELRSLAPGLVKPYLPWLIVGIALLCIVIATSLKVSVDKRTQFFFLAFAVSLLFSLALSSALHTRFLGRHLTPTFPLLAFATVGLIRSRVAFVCLLAVFLLSDLRMTILPEYWKDDYRSAVSFVSSKDTDRSTVIDWAADGQTAAYYGLDLHYPGNPVAESYIHTPMTHLAWGIFCANLSPASARAFIARQLSNGKVIYLALSKADLYDMKAGWKTVIMEAKADNVANFRSFQIFKFSPRTT